MDYSSVTAKSGATRLIMMTLSTKVDQGNTHSTINFVLGVRLA